MFHRHTNKETMTFSESCLRANIRNAYFCEDTDVILDQINQRLVQGKKFEAACLRELLDECLDEIFDSVK